MYALVMYGPLFTRYQCTSSLFLNMETMSADSPTHGDRRMGMIAQGHAWFSVPFTPPHRYRRMDSAPLLLSLNLTLAWSVLQLDHTFSLHLPLLDAHHPAFLFHSSVNASSQRTEFQRTAFNTVRAETAKTTSQVSEWFYMPFCQKKKKSPPQQFCNLHNFLVAYWACKSKFIAALLSAEISGIVFLLEVQNLITQKLKKRTHGLFKKKKKRKKKRHIQWSSKSGTTLKIWEIFKYIRHDDTWMDINFRFLWIFLKIANNRIANEKIVFALRSYEK